MTVHDEQVSQRHPDTSDVRKAVRGAAIGNTVEWFDFAVYSVLATYIADKFFPSGNDTVALLNTFAVSSATVCAPGTLFTGASFTATRCTVEAIESAVVLSVPPLSVIWVSVKVRSPAVGASALES